LAKNDRTPFGKIKRKCRGESMMSSLWGFWLPFFGNWTWKGGK
jgi:hypothetical protein